MHKNELHATKSERTSCGLLENLVATVQVIRLLQYAHKAFAPNSRNICLVSCTVQF